MNVYLIGFHHLSPRSGRDVIYHSWSGCLGHWRPSVVVELLVLSKIVGTGHSIPCGRCLRGGRPA